LIKEENMKQFFVGLILCIGLNTFACDVCGCFMGIVPYDNQSSIGLMHRYRAFNGYRHYQSKSKMFVPGSFKTMHGDHEHDSIVRNYSSADYETFKVFELRVKYFIHRKVELNCFTGISNNKSKEDSIKINHTGLNDPSFFIGYHVLQPSIEKDWKHRLIIGAGIKLPSGNYYAKDEQGNRLPFLMQPGTGSVDYFSYFTYVLGYKNFGLSTNSAFKYNGKNYYSERLGNSFTANYSLFYKINTKNCAFIPNINSYYEYTSGLYVFNQQVRGTAMNELMLGLGFDMFYKNLGLNLGWQKTVKQATTHGNLQSAGRVFAALTYNFNQRKYLLGKKEE